MTRRIFIATLVAAMLLLPVVIRNDYYVNLATQILIAALLAQSLNVLLGQGGMVSLGHAAYLGIAGYGCVLLTLSSFNQLTSAVGAVLLGTTAAALFGVLALRASGLGFLMITLALGQIVWGVAYRWNDLTGGDNGIRYPARPSPFGIDLAGAGRFYYFTLVIWALATYAIFRLSRSAFGASLRGTRDQPRRMRMLGHNVWLIRWFAFVLSGFWASIASLLYVYYNLFISPHALSLQQSAEMLLMAILGGANTLAGPVVGAALITLVKNVVSTYVDRWNSLLGALFVGVVVFMPYGLVPGATALMERLRRSAVRAKFLSGADAAGATK